MFGNGHACFDLYLYWKTKCRYKRRTGGYRGVIGAPPRVRDLVNYMGQKPKCFRRRTVVCQRTECLTAKTEGA